MLALAPGSGRCALSHVAGLSVWTEPAAAAFSKLPKEVTYYLYGSSEDRMGLSLKLAPEPLGVQRSAEGPCAVLCMIAP